MNSDFNRAMIDAYLQAMYLNQASLHAIQSARHTYQTMPVADVKYIMEVLTNASAQVKPCDMFSKCLCAASN
jgi:hypothetical protein